MYAIWRQVKHTKQLNKIHILKKIVNLLVSALSLWSCGSDLVIPKIMISHYFWRSRWGGKNSSFEKRFFLRHELFIKYEQKKIMMIGMLEPLQVLRWIPCSSERNVTFLFELRWDQSYAKTCIYPLFSQKPAYTPSRCICVYEYSYLRIARSEGKVLYSEYIVV